MGATLIWVPCSTRSVSMFPPARPQLNRPTFAIGLFGGSTTIFISTGLDDQLLKAGQCALLSRECKRIQFGNDDFGRRENRCTFHQMPTNGSAFRIRNGHMKVDSISGKRSDQRNDFVAPLELSRFSAIGKAKRNGGQTSHRRDHRCCSQLMIACHPGQLGFQVIPWSKSKSRCPDR